MNTARRGQIHRLSSWLIVILLILPVAAAGQDTTAPQSQTETPNPAAAPVALPDSPGSARAPESSQEQADGAQHPSAQPDSNLRKPVGTAAAGPVDLMGVAASRPAGAALAPAKQRRVRLIMIRVGVIAAAAAALGTTVALTAAGPGRPPGAH